MNQSEVTQLYARMNGTDTEWGDDCLLHDLVAHRCRLTPENIAVVWEDQSLTYAQLDRLSDQIADRLRREGVAPGTLVGICCSRQLDMPALLLGILKAGGAYVPLDPDYPKARLVDMVDDSRVSIILAHMAQKSLVESLGTRVIFADQLEAASTRDGAHSSVNAREVDSRLCLKRGQTLLERQPVCNKIACHIEGLTPFETRPSQTAYVIYTSGSTGKPKGVVISHRSAVNLLRSMQQQPGFRDTDRILATTTLSFDISVVEMFLPLVTGGSLAIVDRETAKDAQRLSEAIHRHAVSVIQATPAMWRMLLESDFVGGKHLTFYTGGEPLPRDLLQHMLPHCREVWNMYGPTEATVYASVMRLTGPDERILIGWPVANTELIVVDEHNELCPPETAGELLIAGVQLATGYLNRPDLTAEKFVTIGRKRYYRTGDLARVTIDGLIDHLGRIDAQVKLNGHRIELGEIEAALAAQAGVRRAAVTLREDAPGQPRLVGYVLTTENQSFHWPTVRESLRARLPEYMVPAIVVAVDKFYYTPSGKLDRQAFPPPQFDRNALSADYVSPRSEIEHTLVQLWQAILQVEPVGVEDNFFELGGNSLRAATFLHQMKARCGLQLSRPKFFDAPTIRGAIQSATQSSVLSASAPAESMASSVTDDAMVRGKEARAFAIVGMSARFPGAANLQQYWQNLVEGVESIQFFKPEELDPSLDPTHVADPRYVPARGVIDGAEMFDAAFFSESPKSASLIDPQQRVMLEVAYEALEDAAIRTDQPCGRIGVWAGTYNTTYHTKNLLSNPQVVAENGEFQLSVANEKDYIASRVAYKLNLTGPAINVNTACSTSLVAVIEACNSLAAGHCDAAIAGACSIHFPQHSGHIHQTGSIFSPDGHCRPFDANGAGTIFSDGAGAIVLKRLDDAWRDGDRIYATIRGLGINNDGTRKASFSAPTISGEAGAVAMALKDADFSPRSISYIEAHGTATPVGDPIEIAALQAVFEPSTTDRQFCAIGSVKSNIGHTVAAAGMAGLIKTALALHHQVIPRTLHYQRPFTEINFETSPFYVCQTNKQWPHDPTAAYPRRAGVSSFGVGGTNAHVVLEESTAPWTKPALANSKRNHQSRIQLWPISAKSGVALEEYLKRLQAHCQHTQDSVDDIAFTLQTGRAEFAHRAVAIGTSLDTMQHALSSTSAKSLFRQRSSSSPPPIVFMFPGQGAQVVNMGRSLFESSSHFKHAFDRCCEILQPFIAVDLRTVLFADDLSRTEREQALRETRLAQPALFAIGYSLGKTMQQWGIQPTAMVGHSIGELAAACLAGVLSLEDALELIARRGSLMQSLPSGSMLSVRLPGEQVEQLLHRPLAIAAYNGPNLCVVAGPDELLKELQARLEASGVVCKPLQTSHAFHSPMMDEVVEPFCQLVRSKQLLPPTMPIMSTVTGQWLTDEQATDPQYWANHLRLPVRFADAVKALWSQAPESVLLELGPRRTLATLARQQATDLQRQITIATLGDSESVEAELHSVLSAIAQLWCCGAKIDWQRICPLKSIATEERPHKVSLPTYPFQRQRHFIDPPRAHRSQSSARVSSAIPESTPMVKTMTRKPLIHRTVREVLENTSGFELAQHDDSTSFFEIGFDSLMMTQTAKALSLRFQVDISFRQLLEQTTNLASLTDWLDERLPATEFAVVAQDQSTHSLTHGTPVANATTTPSASAPTAPATIPLTATAVNAESGSSLHALMMGQLQTMQSIMQAQLQALAGGNVAGGNVAGGNIAPTINQALPLASVPSAENRDSKRNEARHDVRDQPAPKAFGAAARVTLTENDLTDSQQQAIEKFCGEYVARRTESKRQAQQHRRYLADARTVSGFRPSLKEMTFPLVVNRSKGVHLWDVDGNSYIDLTCGFGSNFLGHGPDFMIEAMTQQLQTDYSIGPQTPLAGEVARLFSEITGCERVAFANSGSEAVLGATRLARTYTGKDKIVMFHGDYHGILDEVIVRGNSKLKSFPAATGIPSQHVGNTLLLEYGDPASLEIIQNQLHELAAIVVEPVQSRRPELQPREFLQKLARITESADTALIMDEVITGLRIAPGGAQQYFGVQADIATYGKVVGGGMPIGVIAGKAKYMDGFDGGFWQYGDDSRPEAGMTYFAGTFCRHPVTMAAAKRILEFIQAEGEPMYARLNALADNMARQLNDVFRSLGAPLFLANFGSLFKVQFQQESPFSELVFARLRHKGYFIWDHRPCLLTIQHTQQHLDGFVNAFRETIVELQSQGLLAGEGYKQLPDQLSHSVHAEHPDARPGKDRQGNPGFFVADALNPGRFLQVGVRA